MKTLIFILLMFFTWTNTKALKVIERIEYANDVEQTILEIKTVFAIAKVESEFNPDALNKKENAAGILQIRPIMRREVNRLLKKEVYTDSCRFNAVKSIEMFLVIQRHYNPSCNQKTAAILWNTGSLSPKGDIGKVYWSKVKQMLYKNNRMF